MKPMHHTAQDSYSSFSMKCYFKEISRFPLLSRAEELELGKRIQNGDFEARERMINANLRLVAKVANDYANYGLPIEDLIGEGNIGLMKAAERFDPEFGVKFSTYAVWWIKQMIKRALGNQSRTIRLPLHVLEKLRSLDRAERDQEGELLSGPGGDEAEICDGITRKKARELRQLSQPVVSFDDRSAVDGVDSENLEANIPDDSMPIPLDALIANEMSENLLRAMSVLNSRELDVVVSRFGLSGGAPQTLEEVGERFGVTRERIRQIQKVAIEKLNLSMKRLDQKTPPVVVVKSGSRKIPRIQPRLEAIPA
jgi:RNA polymerase primary sigma factor